MMSSTIAARSGTDTPRRLFTDRDHAGVLLARHVTVHLGIVAMPRRPLVIAVPHGGLPVAARVAAMIGADLRAVVVRRVTAADAQRTCLATVTAEGPQSSTTTASAGYAPARTP